MSSPWKEQREGAIKLTDDCPAIFQIYVHWLYTRTIKLQKDYDYDRRYPRCNPRTLALAKALVMGDALMDDAFMFAVEQKLVEKPITYIMAPFGMTTQFIWENSAPNSRPRRIVEANMMFLNDHAVSKGWRQEYETYKPESWTIELCDEVLFARIGVGRDR